MRMAGGIDELDQGELFGIFELILIWTVEMLDATALSGLREQVYRLACLEGD